MTRRSDIDGIRGIAVLAVVLFHAFPRVIRGGFVGVDVFFVLSGYLITGIILEDLGAGRFSFAAFYGRRVRRIFPALVVVLVAVAAIGWLFLFAREFLQLGRHVAGGAAFVSNLVLWNESGYFDNASETKPLLHLWSLGIEEQFYLAWPLLMVCSSRLRVHRWLVAVLGAVSLVACVAMSRTFPADAFYSPLTRWWEILIGAALAVRERVAGRAPA